MLFLHACYTNIIIVSFQCTDIPITSELFVNVIKSTGNLEELQAVKDLVTKEMANLVSKVFNTEMVHHTHAVTL